MADSVHGICYIVKNNIYCKNSMSSMVICSSALVLPCHPEVAVGVWHVVLQVWSCSVESSVQEHLKHTHISVGQGLCYIALGCGLWNQCSLSYMLLYLHVYTLVCWWSTCFRSKKCSPVTWGTVFSSSLIIDHTRISQSLTLREEDLRPKAGLMSDCVSMCSLETCIYCKFLPR